MFLTMCTIVNYTPKAYNRSVSRNMIHTTYTACTYIFLKVFWIRTNTVNVRGKTVLTWMNQRVLINVRVNYCALRWIAWKERVRAHVVRRKQGHIVRFVNVQSFLRCSRSNTNKIYYVWFFSCLLLFWYLVYD